MREESRSVTVNLPVEVVWDYLSDYDRVVRLGWKDAGAKPLDDSRRCQARYKAHTTWEGLRNTYTACLETAKRPETLTWSTERSGSRSWVRFDLVAQDAKTTRLTATLHHNQGRAFRALEPFAWGLLRPAFLQTLSRLEHLDQEV